MDKENEVNEEEELQKWVRQSFWSSFQKSIGKKESTNFKTPQNKNLKTINNNINLQNQPHSVQSYHSYQKVPPQILAHSFQSLPNISYNQNTSSFLGFGDSVQNSIRLDQSNENQNLIQFDQNYPSRQNQPLFRLDQSRGSYQSIENQSSIRLDQSRESYQSIENQPSIRLDQSREYSRTSKTPDSLNTNYPVQLSWDLNRSSWSSYPNFEDSTQHTKELLELDLNFGSPSDSELESDFRVKKSLPVPENIESPSLLPDQSYPSPEITRGISNEKDKSFDEILSRPEPLERDKPQPNPVESPVRIIDVNFDKDPPRVFPCNSPLSSSSTVIYSPNPNKIATTDDALFEDSSEMTFSDDSDWKDSDLDFNNEISKITLYEKNIEHSLRIQEIQTQSYYRVFQAQKREGDAILKKHKVENELSELKEKFRIHKSQMNHQVKSLREQTQKSHFFLDQALNQIQDKETQLAIREERLIRVLRDFEQEKHEFYLEQVQARRDPAEFVKRRTEISNIQPPPNPENFVPEDDAHDKTPPSWELIARMPTFKSDVSAPESGPNSRRHTISSINFQRRKSSEYNPDFSFHSKTDAISLRNKTNQTPKVNIPQSKTLNPSLPIYEKVTSSLEVPKIVSFRKNLVESQTKRQKKEKVQKLDHIFLPPPPKKKDPTLLSEPNLTEIESNEQFLSYFAQIPIDLNRNSPQISKRKIEKNLFTFDSSTSEVPDERLFNLEKQVRKQEQQRRELIIKTREELGEQIDEVYPHLFVTSYRAVLDYKRLVEKKITHILVCGPSLDKKFPHHFHYKQINVLDLPSENINVFFKSIFTWIDEILKNPETRLVLHCYAGVSRAPSFAIGYIMWKLKKPLSYVLQVVKNKRIIINPNPGFLNQLHSFEKRKYIF